MFEQIQSTITQFTIFIMTLILALGALYIVAMILDAAREYYRRAALRRAQHALGEKLLGRTKADNRSNKLNLNTFL